MKLIILLNFCLVSTFFDILLFNILLIVAWTPIKNTIFWKSMMRSFRWIEITLIDLGFLLRSANLCKKGTVLGNLRAMKKGNLINEAIFFIYFLSSVCDIHFCIWKLLSKWIFMGSSFRPFWSAKYLNFGGVSCEIRNLPRSIQETYTLRKVKNQILLFLLSWEPNLSDLLVYFCLFQSVVLHRVEARVLKF